MNKFMKTLIKQAEAQGFEVKVSSKGHILFSKDGKRVAVGGGTISDWRGTKNLMASLKRAGFVDPNEKK